MSNRPTMTHPLLRLGRLSLGPGLRDLAPGSAASGLVVTAMVAVPDSPASRSYAWDVAWADAVREASQRGADPATAQALERGAGAIPAGDTQVVVAAQGKSVLTWWLASGAGPSSVRVGPLAHLREVADAAARRPAYVVVLADRDGTDLIVHAVADQVPARRAEVGDRPGAPHDPHPDRPPAQLHGERHLTDSEPESGGQHNAEFIAARVAEAADSVAAHVVIGAGDQHILDAIAAHLPETVGPVTTIAGSTYRIGSRPTELLVDDSDTGVEVPLDDGLVWAAVHQDAIVVLLPDRGGSLAGEPVAALLRRGSAG